MGSQKLSFTTCVYVYSNHPLVQRTAEKILGSRPYNIKSFSPALVQSYRDSKPVLIIDICSVPEWFRSIIQWGFRRSWPIVILADTLRSQDEEIRLISLGVRGIVPMTNVETELGGAIDSVVAGRLWLRRTTLDEYVRRKTAPGVLNGAKLTLREEQIVSCLLNDLSNKEIAAILGIAERTVKFHVTNILQKFNVKNRKGLLSNDGAYTAGSQYTTDAKYPVPRI